MLKGIHRLLEHKQRRRFTN